MLENRRIQKKWRANIILETFIQSLSFKLFEISQNNFFQTKYYEYLVLHRSKKVRNWNICEKIVCVRENLDKPITKTKSKIKICEYFNSLIFFFAIYVLHIREFFYWYCLSDLTHFFISLFVVCTHKLYTCKY